MSNLSASCWSPGVITSLDNQEEFRDSRLANSMNREVASYKAGLADSDQQLIVNFMIFAFHFLMFPFQQESVGHITTCLQLCVTVSCFPPLPSTKEIKAWHSQWPEKLKVHFFSPSLFLIEHLLCAPGRMNLIKRPSSFIVFVYETNWSAYFQHFLFAFEHPWFQCCPKDSESYKYRLLCVQTVQTFTKRWDFSLGAPCHQKYHPEPLPNSPPFRAYSRSLGFAVSTDAVWTPLQPVLSALLYMTS